MRYLNVCLMTLLACHTHTHAGTQTANNLPLLHQPPTARQHCVTAVVWSFTSKHRGPKVRRHDPHVPIQGAAASSRGGRCSTGLLDGAGEDWNIIRSEWLTEQLLEEPPHINQIRDKDEFNKNRRGFIPDGCRWKNLQLCTALMCTPGTRTMCTSGPCYAVATCFNATLRHGHITPEQCRSRLRYSRAM